VFWDDLAQDLEDPQFLREYVAQSIRIATIDRIVNELDGAREAAGLSKADLARAINYESATVRRLFSTGHVNPTLGTLAEVAAALGMRVVLERSMPMTGNGSPGRCLRGARMTLGPWPGAWMRCAARRTV
jgi:DNA-binding phage protein